MFFNIKLKLFNVLLRKIEFENAVKVASVKHSNRNFGEVTTLFTNQFLIMEGDGLICNYKKCRKRLTDVAYVSLLSNCQSNT